MRRANEVASPCVNVCEIDPRSGWCRGCYRTIDEIAHWSQYSVREKRQVLRIIERRARPDGARAEL